jgi:hypothetical protein
MHYIFPGSFGIIPAAGFKNKGMPALEWPIYKLKTLIAN